MTTDEDELASRAQGRIGTVLRGKYRIDRVLGVGGMAVVYKATHRNEAEFAVKMLHPELSIREDVRTRFLREGKAANSVKHPGVVLVVDDDVAEDGAAFLVMELLQGVVVETLWERCGQKMPVAAVLSIADQLLDVLAAAHLKGVVHRDIKPANLFATQDGTLKVLDFGIARVKDVTAGSASGTGTGIQLGTPAFMAPEQAYAKASEIDGQTDVWSVGATLFTLLSGQAVHEGENASQLMIHAATTPARSLTSVAPTVPPAIAKVIDRALAFNKSTRWPSAAEMRMAIHEAGVEAEGAKPSKAALASLVTAEDTRQAEKLLAKPVAAPTSKPSAKVAPIEAAIAKTPEPVVPARSPLGAAGLTAQPVMTSGASVVIPGVTDRPGRRGLIWVAAGVVTLAAVAVIGVKMMNGSTVAIVIPAAATAAAPSPAASPEPSRPQRTDDWRPIAPTASPESPAAVPVEQLRAVRTTSPSRSISVPAAQSAASLTAVSPSPSSSPSVQKPPPPSSASPPPAPSCSVVTEYDRDGQPHFKKVCK
jgi:serine/threonine-protein kinase